MEREAAVPQAVSSCSSESNHWSQKQDVLLSCVEVDAVVLEPWAYLQTKNFARKYFREAYA